MRLSVTVLCCFPRFWVDSDAFWTTHLEGLRCHPRLRRILDQCQPGALGLPGVAAFPLPPAAAPTGTTTGAVRRLGLTHASASGPTAPLCAVVVVAGDAVDGLRVTGGPVDEAVAAVDASGPESSEPVVRGTRAS